jgi:uncharacterized DUF497 family protein
MSTRLPRIDALVWDGWNQAHITKHQVTPVEVEEVVAGETIAHASYKNRISVNGPTAEGQMLTVIIGEVPDWPFEYYVFSARPASRAERWAYATMKGGEPA